MTNECVSSFSSISVLLADSKPMESQLAGALRHHEFHVSSCESELAPVLELADHGVTDVAVLSCAVLQSGESDMAVLRTLHLSYPQIPKIVLMDAEGRELAVQSFRLGARGDCSAWPTLLFSGCANASSKCIAEKSGLPRNS